MTLQHPADRAGKLSYLADALRHAGDTFGGQKQSVDHHVADRAACRFDIVGVRRKDAVGVLNKLLSHRSQRAVDILGGDRGKRPLRFFCSYQKFLCRHIGNLSYRGELLFLLCGEAGTYAAALYNIIQHFGILAVGDNHVDAVLSRHTRRLDLGDHTART